MELKAVKAIRYSQESHWSYGARFLKTQGPSPTGPIRLRSIPWKARSDHNFEKSLVLVWCCPGLSRLVQLFSTNYFHHLITYQSVAPVVVRIWSPWKLFSSSFWHIDKIQGIFLEGWRTFCERRRYGRQWRNVSGFSVGLFWNFFQPQSGGLPVLIYNRFYRRDLSWTTVPVSSSGLVCEPLKSEGVQVLVRESLITYQW